MRKTLKVLAVADPAIRAYLEEKIIQGFCKEVEMDVLPWSNYYDTMLEVFAGKAYYDIVMVAGHLWKRDFVEKGYICPLDFEEEDILPVIVKEMEYKGRYYLSPSFCDGHIIVYRKNILKEVLGKEFKEVITPEEYMEAAEKLYKAGYKIAMKANESEIFTDALPFLRMYGQDVYEEKTEKIQCSKEEVINGLENYCKLKTFALENTDTFGNEEVAEKLRSKEAVMGVTWSGQMGVVMKDSESPGQEKEEFGFATFETAWNVTWSFAISSGCEQRKEANTLLTYLRSKEIDQRAGAISGAPVRKGSYEGALDDNPWYPCELAMFSNAKLLPDLNNAGDKNSILYHQIALAFAGEKTAREAMIEAEREIQSL
ncbi:MAG: extracellular solute-binding protein [Acetivibrio sp.]